MDRPGGTVLVIRKTVERPAGRSMLIRHPAMLRRGLIARIEWAKSAAQCGRIEFQGFRTLFNHTLQLVAERDGFPRDLIGKAQAILREASGHRGSFELGQMELLREVEAWLAEARRLDDPPLERTGRQS